MRENRQSGSEGGGAEANRLSLPLSGGRFLDSPFISQTSSEYDPYYAKSTLLRQNHT